MIVLLLGIIHLGTALWSHSQQQRHFSLLSHQQPPIQNCTYQIPSIPPNLCSTSLSCKLRGGNGQPLLPWQPKTWESKSCLILNRLCDWQIAGAQSFVLVIDLLQIMSSYVPPAHMILYVKERLDFFLLIFLFLSLLKKVNRSYAVLFPISSVCLQIMYRGLNERFLVSKNLRHT